MKIKNIFFSFVFLFALLFIGFLTNSINLLTDWWWFQELHLTDIFLKPLITQTLIGASVGIIAFLFLILNLLIASYAKIPWITFIPGQKLSITGRFITKLSIGISIVLALLLGFVSTVFWQQILLYFHQQPFGQADPIFNKDISWYVFSLPLYTLGLTIVQFLLLVATIGCGIIYTLRGSFHITQIFGSAIAKLIGAPPKKDEEITTGARLHVSFLVALFLFTIAIKTYLSMYGLLTSGSGLVFGATYTDVTVILPLLKVSAGVMAITGLFALWFGISGKRGLLLAGIGGYLLISAATGVIPSVVHRFIVAPNELVKETPFIKNNIQATQQAYGLSMVKENELSGDIELTAEDIQNNAVTINNVRLWDRGPLLSTFSQIQEIRTYYDFASIDNDRYIIDGQLRQIMLSPRELSSDSLPNKNWINERLVFTHGYGVAAGPVNQVTQEGLPVLFVKDLPPTSEKQELTVDRPEIYYGELSNDHVIVKTKAKEFDYPKGEENVSSTYAGKGGVIIDSLWKRIVYSLHFQSLKLLLSDDITTDSRILYHREIKERMTKAVPFLTFDQDPYSVIADGKLYWMADAYTISNDYPYSQPISLHGGQINYIRSAVKVVIDAYDGTITIYQADQKDPIINAYSSIFPGVFKPLSDMPDSLKSHIRYPEDIFTVQNNVYTTYHMDDPEIFYNKEDQWDIPAIAVQGEEQTTTEIPPMDPRHIIMKLPGEQQEEFILMLPFIPRGKDNLAAWMVARNDGEHYGKLSVYRFPKQKLIYGPKQVIARINQDAEIARQITLWDQRGSQVIQGPLLVIPIEASLLYVRPLYLKADSGKIPELKRVIVAYGNKIAMEPTLEQGLSRLFGTETDLTPTETTEENTTTTQTNNQSATEQELIQQANAAYEKALNALQNGDFATFGDEFQNVGDILKR
ncbi:MAG TPA: UPF0182 family protein [Patescibacteria group bacterium]|nr:UPF0182 family protein [Patescibacteria group bacterium]